MTTLDVSLILPSLARGFLPEKPLTMYLALPVKEVILRDDGSSDNTPEIARKLACEKLIYHSNSKTLGSPATRNIGVQKEQHSWVLMGEDDIIMDE